MPDMLSRHQPPAMLDTLHDAVDRLFRESMVVPRFERIFDGFARLGSTVVEKDDSFILQVVLPGIDPDKTEIRVLANALRILGTYEIPEIDGGTVLWRGTPTGTFSEVLHLPSDVDADKAEATYDRGILVLTLPKAAARTGKVIKVKIAK